MGAQVFARYVMHQPFSWSEELSRFAMVWMSFIAASFIMAEGNHISVDIWSQRVTAKTSRIFTMASHLVVAMSCIMLLIGGLNFVMKVHPVGSATLGIPKSYWYGSVAVGLLLMAGHSLVNFWLVLRTGKPYEAEHIDLSEGMEPSSTNENAQTRKSEVVS
jgi:TRAP-type transport system small permease protein